MNRTLSRLFFITVSILIFLILSITGCNTAETRLNAMEERLKHFEDREEIRQLLMDYGKHLDDRDFASLADLFSEADGEWIGGMGSAKSRQGIYDFLVEQIGGPSDQSVPSNYHLFMNEAIDFDVDFDVDLDGNRASANTKWVFVIQNEEGRPAPFYLGHYEDELIRENGEWKFLKRIAYSDIPEDDPTQ